MKDINRFEKIAAMAMANIPAKNCLLLVIGQLTARSAIDRNGKFADIANDLMPIVREIEMAETKKKRSRK